MNVMCKAMMMNIMVIGGRFASYLGQNAHYPGTKRSITLVMN